MLSTNPIVLKGAPVEANSDFSSLKPLSGNGGFYLFKSAFTELREGKNEKELADGSWGHVVYINVTGECCDVKTHASVGKASFTLFLNTRAHFLASQIAALCGIYNKETDSSEYVPSCRTDKNGKEHWTIPALEGKEFIVGLAKSGTYTNQNNETYDQYALTGVLSTGFVSATHHLEGRTDADTKMKDWERFKTALNKQIEYYKDKESQQTAAAVASGAGAATYGNAFANAPTQTNAGANLEQVFDAAKQGGAALEQVVNTYGEPAADPDVPF